MSTTIIRLSEELKVRVAVAAERAGTTTHNFIVQAIAEKTAMEEENAEFHSVADQRYEEFLVTGKAVPWSDMRDYLVRRANGEKPRKPSAKKIAP